MDIMQKHSKFNLPNKIGGKVIDKNDEILAKRNIFLSFDRFVHGTSEKKDGLTFATLYVKI